MLPEPFNQTTGRAWDDNLSQLLLSRLPYVLSGVIKNRHIRVDVRRYANCFVVFRSHGYTSHIYLGLME